MVYDETIASGAFDFFSSGTWTIIRNLAIFFVAAFWLSVALWVYKDARRRIEDPWLVAMATLIGLVPFIGAAGELKTKPTQHSVRDLRSIGIQPDILLCRTDRFLDPDIKKKIALFCDVAEEAVITAKDVDCAQMYEHFSGAVIMPSERGA